MKKLISLLVVVAVMAICLATTVFAAEGAQITVESVDAVRGEEVTVEVSIANNPGFSATKITIEYDAALELVGMDIEGKLLDGGVVNLEKGIVSFAKATNVTEDGVLLTLTFKVTEEVACGGFEVKAVLSNLTAADRSEVAYTTEAGTVGTAHSYGEWYEEKAPSCTEKGVERRDCAFCDAYETREVATVAHSYGAWYEEKAPSCTEKGVERRDCANCDAYETREVATVAHSYGEWYEVSAPSCTEKGVERRDCANCDAYETREVDTIDHMHDGSWVTDEKGHWHECDCGEQIGYGEHTYGEGVEGENGWIVYTCTVCGYEKSEETPPTGDMSAIFFALAAVSATGLVTMTAKKKED